MLGWGLVGVGALLAAGFVASRWFGAFVWLPFGGAVYLNRGHIGFAHTSLINGEDRWSLIRDWKAGVEVLATPSLDWWFGHDPGGFTWFGIASFSAFSDSTFNFHFGSLLLWPPALATTGAGALLILFVRRKYRQPWLCPACRYDLRGLSPGTPCPECNSPIPSRM